MAGKVILHRTMPPATLAAPIGLITGTSAPVEKIVVWDFDAATVWYMDFLARLEGYNGGGLTFTFAWMSEAATSGDCIWSIGIRRINDDAEDLNTTVHTYDYNNVTDTAASAAGEISMPTLAFTNGADMDSWVDGEWGIVRVRRFASDAADTLVGNARLIAISGSETV
jgi:hypothetical protein